MMLYRVMRRLSRPYFHARMKIRFEGEENVPTEGPFLLIMNHQSNLDPMLLHAFCPRRLFTLTKSSVFRSRLMRLLAPRVGAIPTRRYQVDPQSVRVVLRLLDEGQGVGIFPEGERSWDATLQAFRAGVMRLILKSNVPVIPSGIVGTYNVWPRWGHMKWLKVGPGRESITIRYGKPLFFGRHDDRASRECARPEVTKMIETSLQSLIGQ